MNVKELQFITEMCRQHGWEMHKQQARYDNDIASTREHWHKMYEYNKNNIIKAAAEAGVSLAWEEQK